MFHRAGYNRLSRLCHNISKLPVHCVSCSTEFRRLEAHAERCGPPLAGLSSLKVFVKKSKEKVLSDPSGMTYAIPINHATALLREAGVALR